MDVSSAYCGRRSTYIFSAIARPSIRFLICTNLNESAPLNQRHHRLLETQPLVFEFFTRRCRSYVVRLSNNDAYFRKRSWNDKPVPTSHPPAARVFHVDRYDWRTRFLRQKNNDRSDFISRTARAIWRRQTVRAGAKNIHEVQ